MTFEERLKRAVENYELKSGSRWADSEATDSTLDEIAAALVKGYMENGQYSTTAVIFEDRNEEVE